MKIKYRLGNCLYHGTLSPAIKNIKQQGPNETKIEEQIVMDKEFLDNFNSLWEDESNSSPLSIEEINYTDIDGFSIKSFQIKRYDLAKIVNAEGEPIRFSFEGRQSMSAKDYLNIKNYSFSWNLNKWRLKENESQ